jgi:hypothetical protein
MKESLLHFVWSQKRFEHSNLRLFDGREVIIKNHGQFNRTENGPDFQNARILIDSIQWIGNIEIHVRASDWYKHNHHLDSNFKNVILHVVWENDIEVNLKNETIPVIELKNRVHPSVLANYESLQKQMDAIPCERYLHSIDIVFKQQMIDKALINRLSRKSTCYLGEDNLQSIYSELARAIGGNSNQESFEFISKKLPFSLVTEMQHQQRKLAFNTLKELIQNQKSKTQFVAPLFKTKGMRPAGRHEIRIKQFINLIPIIGDFHTIIGLTAPEMIFIFRKKMVHLDKTISFEMQNKILINVLVPYLFSLGSKSIEFREKAIEILEKLPTEKNSTVQKMINLGFSVKNSYQSQAVLEIYSQFCLKKQCLSCSIGSKIINS